MKTPGSFVHTGCCPSWRSTPRLLVRQMRSGALLAFSHLDTEPERLAVRVGASVTFGLEREGQRVAIGCHADSPFLVTDDFDCVLGRSHVFPPRSPGEGTEIASQKSFEC